LELFRKLPAHQQFLVRIWAWFNFHLRLNSKSDNLALQSSN
jgi:hypothetical protein